MEPPELPRIGDPYDAQINYEQINAVLRDAYERGAEGRSHLVSAVEALDADVARALLMRQVMSVLVTKLSPEELAAWHET